MAKRVSVIIPTYNRAAQIGEAIQSVLAQDHPNLEIIVADDGSTDGSADVVAEFGDAVRFFSLPHSGQPAVTRNRGLDQASGDFVAFLDSDDLCLPGKLTLQSAALEALPRAGLVYSDGYYFREDPEQPTGRLLEGLPTPSGDVLGDLLRGNFLLSPAMLLIRRSCLLDAGPFDEDPALVVSEDFELWMRFAARFPCFYVPGSVAAVRRHSESISRDVAALRGCALLALEKLEAANPNIGTSHANALNEGYARNHGAIALAHVQQGQLLWGLRHAWRALRHSLRTPGLGTKALLDWLRRRRARGTSAVP